MATYFGVLLIPGVGKGTLGGTNSHANTQKQSRALFTQTKPGLTKRYGRFIKVAFHEDGPMVI